jgi:uncharacterized OB-fold protein
VSDERTVIIEPAADELTRPYWEAARRGTVSLQRCTACGHVWHPPQPTCPECRSGDVEWVASTGFGTVHTFTVVHHAAHRAVVGTTPYVVALVELHEGPRVVCNVVGCPPTDVSVGAAVRFALAPTPTGAVLPQAFIIERSPEEP